MGEPNREHEDRLASCLLWFGIAFLFAVGLAFAGLPGTPLLPFTKDDPQLTSLLQNIGYGLLGGSLTAVVFRFSTGLADRWQQERTEQALNGLQKKIAEIPTVVKDATAGVHETVAGQQERILEISKLLVTSSTLGIVAIARDRDDPAFFGMTWVQRWQHMIANSKRVDLVCWEDTRIFTFDQWLRQGSPEQTIARLNSGDLDLRILLSALDNPALDLVNAWIEIPGYMQVNVKKAEDFLRQARISTQFPVLRRHSELLAFTLMRGDNELYIMYFFPKRSPGPIIQIAPPPLHDDPRPDESRSRSLFETYMQYFDDLWNKCAPNRQADGYGALPPQ